MAGAGTEEARTQPVPRVAWHAVLTWGLAPGQPHPTQKAIHLQSPQVKGGCDKVCHQQRGVLDTTAPSLG